jgi:WD40 repeat protein
VNADLAGFSAFAASPLSQVLAYAEAISDPTVHIADVKGVEKGSFNIPGVLGVQSLGFSYDGQWLYSLGGLPTFRLSIFDWKNKQEVCYRTSEAPIGTHLSVCPAKSRLFAVYGDSDRDVPPVPPQLSPAPLVHLHFFTFQGSGADYSLPSVVSDIPDPVISFCWSCKLYLCFAGTSNGLIYVIDAITGRIQGSAFHLFALEEVDQVAKSLICTSSYLIVGGSSGHMYWMDLERMKKAEDIVPLDMESPILFQIMFPGSNSLLLGSAANSLLSLDLDPESHAAVEDSIIRLRNCHCGPISAATCLARHLVTAGRDGTLRFWAFQPYLELIQSCTFGKDVLTAVASSPGGKLVVVGSQSGLVRIINTADVNSLALLLRERLHSDAVTALAVTNTHICSGSADGSLVIFENNPVEKFPLIGLLQMKTSIISIGAPAPLASAEQLLVATKHQEVFRFDIPKEDAPECRIGLEALNRAMLKVGSKITRIKAETTLREGQQYFYCCCEDKTVKYYGMPLSTGDLDIVGVDDVESSAPDDVMTGHMKAVTATDLSPNQVLLATGCAGGSLVVRELDVRTAQVQQTLFNAVHHDPFTGAISSITFVPDGRRFFTVGFDGAINMYSVKHAPIPTPVDGFELPVGCFQNSVSKIFPIENQLNDLPTIWKRRGYDPDMNDPFKSSEDDPGWEDTSLIEQMRLQKQKNQEKEAEAYKEAILNQLQNIRGEFMTLVQENEEAPELEKLTQNDFTLDTVAADRLQQLAQLRVELVAMKTPAYISRLALYWRRLFLVEASWLLSVTLGRCAEIPNPLPAACHLPKQDPHRRVPPWPHRCQSLDLPNILATSLRSSVSSERM